MQATIVILTYNNLDLNKNCIESVFKYTTGDFEVIVVDNGSQDKTAEYLANLKNSRIKIILNKKNLGFAKGNNLGAKKASGDILVFLNNDTKVTKGWLEPLIKELDNEKTGIVGPKMLYSDSRIQHAGLVISSEHLPRHIYRLFPSDFKPANQKREYKAVTGACLVIKRNLWEKVGGFDEKYINGLEDTDLCFKVRDLGYKVIYVPESVVIHYESISKNRFKHVFRNRELFLKRWEDVKPDEDDFYMEDGFGPFFIFWQHIKNRYLTGNYLDKIKILAKNLFRK